MQKSQRFILVFYSSFFVLINLVSLNFYFIQQKNNISTLLTANQFNVYSNSQPLINKIHQRLNLNVYKGWYDYFDGNYRDISSDQYGSITDCSGYVYVHNCNFYSCHNGNGAGGGILFYNGLKDSDTKLLIEDCMFKDCHCKSKGGAFAMYESGQAVISKVCMINCYSDEGQSYSAFSLFFYYGNSNDRKNNALECSVAAVRYDYKANLAEMCYNHIEIRSVNISNNNLIKFTGLTISDGSQNPGAQIKFSTHARNKCQYIVFALSKFNNELIPSATVDYNNIILNEQTVDNHAVIYSDEYSTIKNTCILQNSSPYAFVSDGGSTTLDHCYVDMSEFRTRQNNNAGLYQNNMVTNTQQWVLHALTFLNRGDCVSSYDVLNILTPVFPTPTPKPTRSPSPSPSRSPSPTASRSPSPTASRSPSPTPSRSPSPTASRSPSPTPSRSPSPSPSRSPSPTASRSPSPTPSRSPSPSPSQSPSPSPSRSPCQTPEITPELTPAITPEITPEPTPAITPMITPEATPSQTSPFDWAKIFENQRKSKRHVFY